MKKTNDKKFLNQDIPVESIYTFLEYTWKDIHHSRLQNWTGITIVATFHIGILKVTEYLLNNNIFNDTIKIILFTSGSLFCLIGFFITRVHQRQLYKKLGWIVRAEEKLCLNILKDDYRDTNDNEKILKKLRKFIKRNFYTVGSLMSYFYLLLMILDIICMFLIPTNFSLKHK